MVTELPRHQTVPAFALAVRVGLGVPLRTHSRVVGIHGHGRLDGVDVEDLRSGAVEGLAADTVVFTGDWIPDHEVARRAGIVLDPATGGPRTDVGGRTSRPGVLAVGALVQPGDTAGLAALGGREAARRLAASWSAQGPGPAARAVSGLPVTVVRPLSSVVPSVVDPLDRPGRLLVRTGSFTDHRLLVARQGGSEVGRHRLRHATPHRTLTVPGSVLARVTPDGGAVELSLV